MFYLCHLCSACTVLCTLCDLQYAPLIRSHEVESRGVGTLLWDILPWGSSQQHGRVVSVIFSRDSGARLWYMWARGYLPVVEAVQQHVLRTEDSDISGP